MDQCLSSEAITDDGQDSVHRLGYRPRDSSKGSASPEGLSERMAHFTIVSAFIHGTSHESFPYAPAYEVRHGSVLALSDGARAYPSAPYQGSRNAWIAFRHFKHLNAVIGNLGAL